MNIKKKYFWGIFIFFLTGCGYHFGPEEICKEYSTICVPFVEGDREGSFTAALIKQLASSGCWGYKNVEADLILQATLLPPEEMTIGFAFAPADQGDNEFPNIIVANEARLSLAAQVILIKRSTGEKVLGPFKVGRSLDYDFESDLTNRDFHAFSLGQLEMHNLAQESAMNALYDLLAEKVINYVIHGW